MGAIASKPLRAGVEVITFVMCAVAMLAATVAIPYWFGQAFGYSGAVGRSEIEARTAAALFECRATIVFRAASSLVVCSLLARMIYLGMANHGSWQLGIARSCAEHLVVGLAWWGVLALMGVPIPIERSVAAFANRFCQ